MSTKDEPGVAGPLFAPGFDPTNPIQQRCTTCHGRLDPQGWCRCTTESVLRQADKERRLAEEVIAASKMPRCPKCNYCPACGRSDMPETTTDSHTTSIPIDTSGVETAGAGTHMRPATNAEGYDGH